MKNTFPKSEHLYGLTAIDMLHNQGDALLAYPFRVLFLRVTDEREKMPVRAMVSVSKKRFKKAVDRNRVKRLMREAYRLNKSAFVLFSNERNVKIHCSFQYIASEILPFDEMNKKMQKALAKLMERLAQHAEIADGKG